MANADKDRADVINLCESTCVRILAAVLSATTFCSAIRQDILHFSARVFANRAAYGLGRGRHLYSRERRSCWPIPKWTRPRTRDFLTLRLHAHADLSEVTPTGDKIGASPAAFVVSWRGLQVAGTLGKMLRGSPPSEIGVRPSWRRRVPRGCGFRYRRTSRQESDREKRSGCAGPAVFARSIWRRRTDQMAKSRAVLSAKTFYTFMYETSSLLIGTVCWSSDICATQRADFPRAHKAESDRLTTCVDHEKHFALRFWEFLELARFCANGVWS